MRTDVKLSSASILADSSQSATIPGDSGIWVRPIHTSLESIGQLDIEAESLYSELCYRSEPSAPWVMASNIAAIAHLHVRNLIEVRVGAA